MSGADASPSVASGDGLQIGDSSLDGLMQDVAAALGEAVMGGRRIKLGNLGFQMLVDHQKRFQCAAKVTIATGYNFVDDSFSRSKSHRTSPTFPAD
jgi:hypothetical protein